MRTNRHHLLPRSKGGSDVDINIKNWAIDKHMDHHAVFSNKTPLEQLLQVFNLNHRIWSDSFRSEMYQLFDSFSGGLAYSDLAIRDKKKLIEVLS